MLAHPGWMQARELERVEKSLESFPGGFDRVDGTLGAAALGRRVRAGAFARWRAQERRADGHAPGAERPGLAAVRQPESVVGRQAAGRSGQGDGPLALRLLDHRRNELPQSRGPLGGRATPVLRRVGQEGQLPDRRQPAPRRRGRAAPASRWPGGSTCPRAGPGTRSVASVRASRRRSSTAASSIWPWDSSTRRWAGRCPPGSCSPTRRTAAASSGGRPCAQRGLLLRACGCLGPPPPGCEEPRFRSSRDLAPGTARAPPAPAFARTQEPARHRAGAARFGVEARDVAARQQRGATRTLCHL